MHSKSNGQVERFHSTLLEIARCIKVQQNIDETTELLLLSTLKYNDTIHSVTGRKPIDIINGFEKNSLVDIRKQLQTAQDKSLNQNNKNTSNKVYHPGEIVFVRRNKRLGNKFDKVFEQEVIERDLGTTVMIKGKKVHKENLR